MLSLHIGVGESLLAHQSFELHLLQLEEYTCRLRVEVAAISQMTVIGPGGKIQAQIIRPGEPYEFNAGLGSRIRIGASSVQLWPHRTGDVKLAIDAPKEIRFTRPAQHGGSLAGA
jgi:sRNA-binding carbon storage regulator CsrA